MKRLLKRLTGQCCHDASNAALLKQAACLGAARRKAAALEGQIRALEARLADAPGPLTPLTDEQLAAVDPPRKDEIEAAFAEGARRRKAAVLGTPDALTTCEDPGCFIAGCHNPEDFSAPDAPGEADPNRPTRIQNLKARVKAAMAPATHPDGTPTCDCPGAPDEHRLSCRGGR